MRLPIGNWAIEVTRQRLVFEDFFGIFLRILDSWISTYCCPEVQTFLNCLCPVWSRLQQVYAFQYRFIHDYH